MKLSAKTSIDAPKEAIWSVITDIENATNNLQGVEKVEILEQPSDGLVGLKWVETRTIFGKTATETMWITEAVENKYYQTRAENHGAIYTSRMEITEEGGQHFLNMSFSSKTETIAAKIMAGVFGFMFKGATKKLIAADLEDIKATVEAKVNA
ncbi:MAG: SRPBCC family protein [Bacteroidota bacterium]